MTSRRVLKAAQAVREVVSMAILTDLKDPRIEGVTVTYVEVSGDMRVAKVHVSVMGDDAAGELCLHGLQSAAGYLQKKIARRINTKYTPRLRFQLDMGVKKSIAIAKMLSEVLPESTPTCHSSEEMASEEMASEEMASEEGATEESPQSDGTNSLHKHANPSNSPHSSN
jgi:ribosome-binding factor A